MHESCMPGVVCICTPGVWSRGMLPEVFAEHGRPPILTAPGATVLWAFLSGVGSQRSWRTAGLVQFLGLSIRGGLPAVTLPAVHWRGFLGLSIRGGLPVGTSYWGSSARFLGLSIRGGLPAVAVQQWWQQRWQQWVAVQQWFDTPSPRRAALHRSCRARRGRRPILGTSSPSVLW